MTREIHDQKQSIPAKKEAARIMLPQESTITRQASVRRVHIQNQANSQTETRQATVRRVHMENQANPQTETRQPTVRRVHIENQANSQTDKTGHSQKSPH